MAAGSQAKYKLWTRSGQPPPALEKMIDTEKLRQFANYYGQVNLTQEAEDDANMVREAADLIEQQAAELERLRAALIEAAFFDADSWADVAEMQIKARAAIAGGGE